MAGLDTGSAQLLVLWSDGDDSYLHLVNISSTYAGTFTATFNNEVDLLATFEGVQLTGFTGTTTG
jgi:hypothetical protein